jgi:hypothetical protein
MAGSFQFVKPSVSRPPVPVCPADGGGNIILNKSTSGYR